MNQLYRINLRGKEFISSSELLREFLQNLVKSNLAVIRQNGEIFVDRNPMIFYNVLDYYSGDGFHLPKNICPIQALKEVEFWKIPSKDIPSCCYEVLYDEHEAQYNSIENFDSDLKTQANQTVSPLYVEKKTKPSLERLRFRLLEAHTHPFSTWSGRVGYFLFIFRFFISYTCINSEIRIYFNNCLFLFGRFYYQCIACETEYEFTKNINCNFNLNYAKLPSVW